MSLGTLVKAAPKAIKSFAVRRSPEIFLALGIGGSLAAIIFGIKSTPKAMKAIEERKEEIIEANDLDMEPEALVLRPIDAVKASWKCYIPTAIFFTCSVICLISGNRVSAKRNAAIAAACTIAEETARQYKEALAETVEPEIKEKIEEKVAEKKLESHNSSNDIYVPPDSDMVACWDPWSGRDFISSKNEIESAINAVNAELLNDGYAGTACLNDFYEHLSDPRMDDTKSGAILEWELCNDYPVKSKLHAQIKNGKPVLVLDFDPAPESKKLKFK